MNYKEEIIDINYKLDKIERLIEHKTNLLEMSIKQNRDLAEINAHFMVDIILTAIKGMNKRKG